MPTRQFRPDPQLQTKYIITVLLIFVFCFLPLIFIGFAPGAGWLYVFVAIALVIPYYRSISFELTDEEVVVRKGILTKSTKTVPYRAITNAEVKRGPLDRLFGLGTVDVHTAGYSQQAGAEAPMMGLRNYDEVYTLVMDAVRRARGTAGALTVEQPEEGPGAPVAPAAVAPWGEILAELRAIRELLSAR